MYDGEVALMEDDRNRWTYHTSPTCRCLRLNLAPKGHLSNVWYLGGLLLEVRLKCVGWGSVRMGTPRRRRGRRHLRLLLP